jgi:hypothetical protein
VIPRFFAEIDINRGIPCFIAEIAEIPNFAVFPRFKLFSGDFVCGKLNALSALHSSTDRMIDCDRHTFIVYPFIPFATNVKQSYLNFYGFS